jgi:uncharacterized protein (DUF58 family)
VTPHVDVLPDTALRGEWGGAGQSTNRAVSTHGDDDVATREYRHGDDLRRIHWRTTARRGELTVRREEQPWESRAAVLLDARLVAHRGDGPASSLEWAISAAASVSRHLAQRGFDVRLVTDAGGEVSSSALGAAGFDGAMLDVLAGLSPSNGQTLHVGVESTRQVGGQGLIIAIVGAIQADDADRLARLRAADRSTGVVFMLDTESWAPTSAATQVRDHDRAVGLLTAAGWRVVRVRRGDSIARLWGDLGPAAPQPQHASGAAVS